ncbi:hypothetical protein GCM10007350_05950 [Jeongeupia chitinilytica]|uniref:Dienelactone hydrolase domain-containing protein n=1 Tax=Jeongeupia chitinilytica TaxID=1041641 RepID=A0ABQ3GVQ4_9NEIS|nr:hypothetical protein GCM10007350_05950 [Jeongeupia chitinilytica]
MGLRPALCYIATFFGAISGADAVLAVKADSGLSIQVRDVIKSLLWGLLLLAPIPAFAVPVAFGGSNGTTLTGEYFPPPNGAQRAPAMLLLHGCGGLWSRPGVLTVRHARMASLLQELGYGVLLLDSFSNRGLREQCTVPASERRVNVQQRVDDAQRAVNWLKLRREIDANRVGALGWSNGATTLLNLVGKEKPGIKTAVAFYPGCAQLARRARYVPAVPTLILIGEADDWTPAEACQRLAEKVADDTFHLVTYPDTYHDFDVPGNGTRVRKDVPAAVDPSYGVTIAPNQTATDDAYRRTFKWIGRWLDPDRLKPSRNDYNPVLRLQ